MGRLIEDPALKNRTHVYEDRSQAGRHLASFLSGYQGRPLHLFAIPAGGVPVGAEIARHLAVPLDLIIVRKVQLPWTTEAGFGAVNPAGEAIFNEEMMHRLPLADEEIEAQVQKAAVSIRHREERLRRGKPYARLHGLPAIIADDGLASGYTMRAAIQFLKRQDAGRIIVAVPTGSDRTVQELATLVDELYCPNVRGTWSFAVAEAYEKWYDLTEEEVLDILQSLTPSAES